MLTLTDLLAIEEDLQVLEFAFEHDDFLKLQSAAVIRIHHQHRLIDNSVFLKRHRFLTGADRLNDHVIETGTREQREAIVRRR